MIYRADIDDAGGGGIVHFDNGTFATVDCTIFSADSSMLFSFVGTGKRSR